MSLHFSYGTLRQLEVQHAAIRRVTRGWRRLARWLVGSRIYPRAVGRTAVEVKVGDRDGRMNVFVHEVVGSFEGLRPDQQLVAIPVHLAQGDTVQWTLPVGAIWLKYLPRRQGEAPPTITLEGAGACAAGDGLRDYRVTHDVYAAHCTIGSAGASVKIAHGMIGAAVVDGTLAIERVMGP